MTEKSTALIREVVNLPDILFVMDKGPGVMEAWITSEETKVEAQGNWLAVESRGWHCHLNLSEVEAIRFVEEPDVHDLKRQAFSVRLLRKTGEPLVMIFFCEMYDDQGVLSTSRVERFRALGARYGDSHSP